MNPIRTANQRVQILIKILIATLFDFFIPKIESSPVKETSVIPMPPGTMVITPAIEEKE